MEGKVRASKTPSKSNSGRDTSSRNSSPPSPIQTTSGAPNTPKIKSKRGSKHVSNQDRTRSRRGKKTLCLAIPPPNCVPHRTGLQILTSFARSVANDSLDR